jgi:WD40 repeat protein
LAIHQKNHNFLMVGRQAATADLRIDHKSISRKHAVLYYIKKDKHHRDVDNGDDNNNHTTSHSQQQQQLQLMIRDLETKKHTRVNGLIIPFAQPTQLQHHDTIQFGQAQPIFTVEWEYRDNDEVEEDRKIPAISSQPKSSRVQSSTSSKKTVVSDPLQDEEDEEEEEGQGEEGDQVEVGAGLTGRAKREAEIAAMMASLEATPTYQKFTLQEGSDPPRATQKSSNNNNNNNKIEETGLADSVAASHYDVTTAQQYRLPLQDSLSVQHHGVELASASSAAPSFASSITCLALDPTGARFAVGSNDGSLRLYDFAGLNPKQPMPFTTITVQDGYRVVDACYSPNGDRLLIATGSAQPKLLDRDGNELLQLVRGDVYVTDPTKTVGHTAAVTCVAWHPLEKNKVLTGSDDGSVRLWDVERGKLQFQMLTCSQTILIKSVTTNLKTVVTTVAFAPGGREFVVGTGCGSIQIWNLTKSEIRPQRAIQVPSGTASDNDKQNSKGKKHSANLAIYSAVYNIDGSLLASRTVKTCHVWNPQKLSRSSTPLVSCQNVSLTDENPNDTSTPSHPVDDMALAKAARDTLAFSPEGTILCVGCMDHQSKKATILNFYVMPSSLPSTGNHSGKHDTAILGYPILLQEETTSEPQAVSHSSSTTSAADMIVGVQWHPKLNQILVATTQKSIEVLFDAKFSRKGVLLVTPGGGGSRHYGASSQRHRGEEDLQELYQQRAPPPGSHVRGEIFTPNSLPLFRDDTIPGAKLAGGGARKKKRDMVDEDTKQRRPEPPAKGMKAMAGQSAGTSTFTQFIVDATNKQQKQIAGRDPREALFQYKEGKTYIGDAYKGNVEVVLADKTVEQDEDEQLNPPKK